MKFMVSGYKGAKNFEGTLDAAMQQLMAASSQHAQTPPKPTPAEMKIQCQQMALASNERIAQSTNETNRMIAQMQGQLKAQDLQIKALEASTKAKEVDSKIQHNQASLHIDAMDSAHRSALDYSGLGGI